MIVTEEDTLSPSFLQSINFIHEVKIFNEIQNNKKILIFDFRKKEDFIRSNLDFSLNLPYDEYAQDIFKVFHQNKLIELAPKEELKEMLKKYKRFYIVIIMSELKIPIKKICKYDLCDEHEKEIIIKSLLFYKSLVKNRVREIGLFNLGFKTFVEHYEFLVIKNNCSPIAKYFFINLNRDISNFPSEIFDHKIFIGDQSHAINDDIVNVLKITHIINVTLHVKNVFEDRGVEYLNVKIDDSSGYQIHNHFKEVFDFIQKALTNSDEVEKEIEDVKLMKNEFKLIQLNCDYSNLNELFDSIQSWTVKNKVLQILFKNFYSKFKSKSRILIHCSLGVSRSPAFAIMYVMKFFKLNFSDSYEFIKFQRDKSNPICSFVGELEEFEKNDFKFENESI